MSFQNYMKTVISGIKEWVNSVVPQFPSATVGQTIVVKAVDDTGKPTEWEAVDMPQDFIVTFMTEDAVNFTADKTIAECIAAFEAGRNVRAKLYNGPGGWMNLSCNGFANFNDNQVIEFVTAQVTGNLTATIFNLSYHSANGINVRVRAIPNES